MLLRDFYNDELNAQASSEVAQRIIGELEIDLEDLTPEEAQQVAAQLLADGLSNGAAIAKQTIADALSSDWRRAAKARDQIIATEPKTVTLEPAEPARSPEFVPSKEDEAAFRERASDAGLIH